MRDMLRFSNDIRDRIGKLESIFPVPFLCRAMDNESDVSQGVLWERMKRLFEHYMNGGIDVDKITDGHGNLLPFSNIVESSLRTMNANPPFYIKGIKHHALFTAPGDRVVVCDGKLQQWYANTLRHLDGDE